MNTFNSGYHFSGGTVHFGSERGFLRDLLNNPPSSHSEFLTLKKNLHGPSFEWILSNKDFHDWQQSNVNQLLHIKGQPGKGKTMLLCGIVNTLQQNSKSAVAKCWEPIYFFCQATNNQFNSATSVVRGLLECLFDKHKTIRDKYNRTDITYKLNINNLATLRETFKQVLQDPDFPGAYLIVDALDECRDGLKDLLEIIVDLSRESSTRIKILVSSRDWSSIERELRPLEQKIVLRLELNSSSISDAVKHYITHEVNQLATKKQYDPDTRRAVEQHLSSKSQDTFLWVALVCKALAGMDVRAGHTLQMLEEKFPAGLPNFYGRMMEDINMSQRDADICKQILAIACIVYRPISWSEMKLLLRQPGLQDAKSIIGSCGSFLTITKEENHISFVHQSAKDFLLENQDISAQILPYGINYQHYHIFLTSLQNLSSTLKRNIYELKDPGGPRSGMSPPEPDPLAALRYSCVYWPDHLLELAPTTLQSPSAPAGKTQIGFSAEIYPDGSLWYLKLIQLTLKPLLTLVFLLYDLVLWNVRPREFEESMRPGGIVHRFFEDRYLYWLEALSLLSSIPEGVKAMERLESCSEYRIARGVQAYQRRSALHPITEGFYSNCSIASISLCYRVQPVRQLDQESF
ncbi:unnamed protein product [Penicillium salamii]|nr:unnamed protein product [Penicillium salamii]CAG8342635.1 unnamed protein product [Penicillium salamii]